MSVLPNRKERKRHGDWVGDYEGRRKPSTLVSWIPPLIKITDKSKCS